MRKDEENRSKRDKYISNVKDCKVFEAYEVHNFTDHNAIKCI